MMSLFHWSMARKEGSWLDPEALQSRADELRAGPDIVWIDLQNPTPAEEQAVCEKFFPVHALTLEDITKLRRHPDELPHFPKVEEFKDYLLVIVNPLDPHFLKEDTGHVPVAPDGKVRMTTQLSAVLTHHLLITHHYEPLDGITELKSFLSRHDSQADRGPDYLFHLILDVMVDQYAPLLDHYDESLEELEAEIFSKPSRELLTRLLDVKRNVILLRKTLVYEREVLARLIRGEFDLIDDREMVYYRNVYDHLVRFTELIESSREMVSDLMQTHLAAVSNKLNEIMKALTMISTIVLPMTLIAGIYGMNFENMPEIKWEYGYFVALGLMTLSGICSFVFFRWRKWI